MKRQILIAALLLGAVAPVVATPAAAQVVAQAGRQVPLSRVLASLAQKYPGKQLNTTMGQAGGRPVYMIQWQLADGRIVVFTVDAETGNRGFLLTGDERYLEPYELARKFLSSGEVRQRSVLAPIEQVKAIRARVNPQREYFAGNFDPLRTSAWNSRSRYLTPP